MKKQQRKIENEYMGLSLFSNRRNSRGNPSNLKDFCFYDIFYMFHKSTNNPRGIVKNEVGHGFSPLAQPNFNGGRK